MKPKIFISHAQTDSAYAELLSELLEERGLGVWNGTTINPGEKWDETIGNALKESILIIALISNDYFNSQYSLMELGAAFATQKKIIPVLLSGNLEQMPLRFKNFQVVDAQKTDKDTLLHIIEEQAGSQLAA